MRDPRPIFALGIAFVLAIGYCWSPGRTGNVLLAADQEDTSAVPVEPDMHEFMEYVFQPAYKRLKEQMATEPKDNQGWKAIKSDALILAEGGNLLLIREVEEDQADWNKLSVQSRDLGAELYQAARSKDYPAAKKHYQAMLTKCNACHTQFAHGEHQLQP